MILNKWKCELDLSSYYHNGNNTIATKGLKVASAMGRLKLPTNNIAWMD